jgi:hypothetical protein
MQHCRNGNSKLHEYCNTLDTKGCRIFEVAGTGYNRTVKGYNRLQDTLGCRTGICQNSQGYNRLQDTLGLGYRSGKQQNN